MIKVKTDREILQEILDKYGLPDEVSTIFFNAENGKPIGFSYDEVEEPFVYVNMCNSLKKIWSEYPDACSWDGWEDGIIGNVGCHLVYNVELAQERFFEKNKLKNILDAVEHWEYNVEGSRMTVPSFCRPYHMYEIFT